MRAASETKKMDRARNPWAIRDDDTARCRLGTPRAGGGAGPGALDPSARGQRDCAVRWPPEHRGPGSSDPVSAEGTVAARCAPAHDAAAARQRRNVHIIYSLAVRGAWLGRLSPLGHWRSTRGPGGINVGGDVGEMGEEHR